MTLPRDLTRKTFLVAGAAALVYLAAAVVFGWEEIAAAIRRFDAPRFLLLIGLSLANYGLRFGRWQVLLGRAGAGLPLRASFAVYFATYIMVITPGKLGEVFKAGILRDRYGIALAKGLPVVLAERIYDFLAVLALVAIGLVFWDGPGHGAELGLAAGAAFLGMLLLVRSARLRRLLMARIAASRHLGSRSVGIDESLSTTSDLLAPGPGLLHLAVSTLAWFAECAGLWLVCRELAPQVGLTDSVFIYAAGTLVGSLSFLPGGLGGTEAVMMVLLGTLGVGGPTAAAITFIVRLATLWLAVVVGLGVFAACRTDVVGPAADQSLARRS